MNRPDLLIFDVNETLLDLGPVRASVAEVLGGREDLVPLWFSTMLHHSLVETLSGSFHGFGEIGAAALVMVAEQNGLAVGFDAAEAAISGPVVRLRPHPDVVPGLSALRTAGFRLASLTNSTADAMETQLENAGLTHLLEDRFSVEAVGRYKPDPAPYRAALDAVGVEAGKAVMVAAHPWDLAGARGVGLGTAFVCRPGSAWYPNLPAPDLRVGDLLELADVLGERSSGPAPAG